MEKPKTVRRRAGLLAVVLVLGGLPAWVAPPPATAQPAEGAGSLMIVMDASGSMLADDGTGRTKLDGARAALRQAVAGLPDGAVTGLLVYGANTPSTPAAKAAGCQDTTVVVPPAPLDRGRMTTAIDGFAASGYTPIGRALQQAAAALPAAGQRTVLLVSDGLDTCAPPDPCTVAGQLAGAGVTLKLETVGFQVDPGARTQLQCIARAGGGAYSDAADAGSLAQRLVDVSGRAARSYQAKGTPVKGGASYQDAPVLQPGTYSDSLLAKEESWFAVDLQNGQVLTARATLVIDKGGFRGVGSLFELQVVDPDLANVCCAHGRGYQVNIRDSQTVSVAADSDVVGAKGSDAKRAGRYYVRLTTDGTGTGEFPVELTVEVAGAGAATSSAAAAPPTGPPATTAPGTAVAESGGPPRSVLFAIIGVLSALVLGLGAAVVGLVRRDRARTRGGPPS